MTETWSATIHGLRDRAMAEATWKVLLGDGSDVPAGITFSIAPDAARTDGHCPDCSHEWRDHGPRGCEVRYGTLGPDGMCVCTEPSRAARPPDGLPESSLPARVVVGANGAYWRDYGTHYSMCPVSDDNDPVEVVATYTLDVTPRHGPHCDADLRRSGCVCTDASPEPAPPDAGLRALAAEVAQSWTPDGEDVRRVHTPEGTVYVIGPVRAAEPAALDGGLPEGAIRYTVDLDTENRWLVATDQHGASSIIAKDVDPGLAWLVLP